MAFKNDELSERVIGLAIAVHRQLGPGLLESAYEECLCLELREAGIAFRRQVPLPIIYKSIQLDCGYRLDLVIEDQMILELKSVERLLPDPRGSGTYLYEVERGADWIIAELQHRGFKRRNTTADAVENSPPHCLIVNKPD